LVTVYETKSPSTDITIRNCSGNDIEVGWIAKLRNAETLLNVEIDKSRFENPLFLYFFARKNITKVTMKIDQDDGMNPNPWNALVPPSDGPSCNQTRYKSESQNGTTINMNYYCQIASDINLERVSIMVNSSSEYVYFYVGNLFPDSFENATLSESTMTITSGTTRVTLAQRNYVYIPRAEIFEFFYNNEKRCRDINRTDYIPDLEVYNPHPPSGGNEYNFRLEFQQKDGAVTMVSERANISLDVAVGLFAAYLGFLDILLRLTLYLGSLCGRLCGKPRHENEQYYRMDGSD